MMEKIFFALFSCWMIVKVESDTVYAISGYAFPGGVSTTDPMGIIQNLQQTVQSHYNMIPANVRTESYQHAKEMFDATAARAANVVTNVNRLARINPNGVVSNQINTVTGNLPSSVVPPQNSINTVTGTFPANVPVQNPINTFTENQPINSFTGNLPSTVPVQNPINSFTGTLPSTVPVQNPINSFTGTLPSTVPVQNPINSFTGTLPSTVPVQNPINSFTGTLPSTVPVQNPINSFTGNLPAQTPINNFTGNLPSSVSGPVNSAAGSVPWRNGLPICMKQLLSIVQYFRRQCPLCQMMDAAMRRGGMPVDTYAIDASGNIFQQKGQELFQSNYAFDGQGIIDGSGATIISFYS